MTYTSSIPEARTTSLKRKARIAGLWYLALSPCTFYLVYVPSQTVARNDAAATAARVLGHETLYRWGMVAETLCAAIFIGLSLALYRLFENVDRNRARQLVALVLVSSALNLVAVAFSVGALLIFRGGNAFAGLDAHTRQAIGMLLIQMHAHTEGINEMFWGLWLLPFGSLVIRSRFLPRWLGYWLLLDGIAWVVMSMTWFVAPDYTAALFRYFQPAGAAEIAAILCLLFMCLLFMRASAKEQPSPVAT
ncbi:MAG: DUF4386 domain-containing protein [Candidatus Acidiferrales bacterium]